MSSMGIVEFRFPERLPAREALLRALEEQLGVGVAKRFDGIEKMIAELQKTKEGSK